jgi:hypothetical protein
VRQGDRLVDRATSAAVFIDSADEAHLGIARWQIGDRIERRSAFLRLLRAEPNGHRHGLSAFQERIARVSVEAKDGIHLANPPNALLQAGCYFLVACQVERVADVLEPDGGIDGAESISMEVREVGLEKGMGPVCGLYQARIDDDPCSLSGSPSTFAISDRVKAGRGIRRPNPEGGEHADVRQAFA